MVEGGSGADGRWWSAFVQGTTVVGAVRATVMSKIDGTGSRPEGSVVPSGRVAR